MLDCSKRAIHAVMSPATIPDAKARRNDLALRVSDFSLMSSKRATLLRVVLPLRKSSMTRGSNSSLADIDMTLKALAVFQRTVGEHQRSRRQ